MSFALPPIVKIEDPSIAHTQTRLRSAEPPCDTPRELPQARLRPRHPMDIALDSVIPYGWAILPDGTFISPKGKVMDVRLVCRSRGGYQARSKSSNYLFWSGSDPAEFLERFWFAEKLVR